VNKIGLGSITNEIDNEINDRHRTEVEEDIYVRKRINMGRDICNKVHAKMSERG